MKRRKSRQREMIYEYLAAARIHPTALMVFEELRKKLPSLSLGNLYRNLRILHEEKRVLKKEFHNGETRYEAARDEHSHFICERCGRVYDFELPNLPELLEKARALTKNEIKSHAIEFHGICEKCRDKKL